MFISLHQQNKKDPIILNTDQIVNVRKKADDSFHVSLISFGIDIPFEEWKKLKDVLPSKSPLDI